MLGEKTVMRCQYVRSFCVPSSLFQRSDVATLRVASFPPVLPLPNVLISILPTRRAQVRGNFEFRAQSARGDDFEIGLIHDGLSIAWS
jgi:hypothetical protein